MANPLLLAGIGGVIGGGVSALFAGGDDLEKALAQSQARIRGAQNQLNKDYNQLLTDFDLSLTQFRGESNSKRSSASMKLRDELAKNTDKFVSDQGPLNEASKARIKTLMNVPVQRQLLEFDLGTTDEDLNLGLAGIMGTMNLERELLNLQSRGQTALNANRIAAQAALDAEPGAFGRFLGGFETGASLGLTAGLATK